MRDNKPEIAVPEHKPTARLTVSKEQAMDLKVGVTIRLEVTGEVKEIMKCYNDNEEYDIVLEDPNVQKVSSDGEKEEMEEEKQEKENENLASVPLSDLKKLISKEESK